LQHGYSRSLGKVVARGEDTMHSSCTTIDQRTLEDLFLAQEFLNVMGIIYPQYWLQPNVEDMFPR
jgi:hypothetical protein